MLPKLVVCALLLVLIQVSAFTGPLDAEDDLPDLWHTVRHTSANSLTLHTTEQLVGHAIASSVGSDILRHGVSLVPTKDYFRLRAEPFVHLPAEGSSIQHNIILEQQVCSVEEDALRLEATLSMPTPPNQTPTQESGLNYRAFNRDGPFLPYAAAWTSAISFHAEHVTGADASFVRSAPSSSLVLGSGKATCGGAPLALQIQTRRPALQLAQPVQTTAGHCSKALKPSRCRMPPLCLCLWGCSGPPRGCALKCCAAQCT